MAMLEKHRSSIYRSLVPILGEEETQAMLAQFPAREHDQLATKGDVLVTRAELQREMAQLAADLRGEMAQLAADLRNEMSAIRESMARTVLGAVLGATAVQTAVVGLLVRFAG